MKSVEESIAASMDCSEEALLSHLPYILQDFWEIGASPEVIVQLIRKHKKDFPALKVLDLGCGKGAVSITIASELRCHCYGIDAMSAFIDEAARKAEEYHVADCCVFETGDIRRKISLLKGYDIVILGAIGPVLGDYYTTLSQIAACLNDGGLVIVDDGYIDDAGAYSHPLMLRRAELLRQIDAAGMRMIDEVLADDTADYSQTYEKEFGYIVKRCHELIEKYPAQAALFEEYIKRQRQEYDVIENMIVCSTMVIEKK